MSIKSFFSLFLAITFMLNMFSALPIVVFAATADKHVYEKDGYTVTYKIGSEWDNNRSAEVTIKNTLFSSTQYFSKQDFSKNISYAIRDPKPVYYNVNDKNYYYDKDNGQYIFIGDLVEFKKWKG